MSVWFLAGFIGVVSGLLMPISWYGLQLGLEQVSNLGFTQGSEIFLLPILMALAIFLVQIALNAFRTADSFTYFFSELHYNEGRRNLPVSFAHGLASFCIVLGGGAVGLEALTFEWVSSLVSRISEWARLPGVEVRTLTASALAASIAAMLELPTPAIFFVVEILLGWSSLGNTIGPLALASILAAGMSSSVTGPVGFLHLLDGNDGGLALALRGASLELGGIPALAAFGIVSVVAPALAITTIWLYHRTDYVFQALFSYKGAGMKMVYTSNGARLALWAVLTGIVLIRAPELAGLGVKLLQDTSWNSMAWHSILALVAVRLALGALSYCALGSIGLILPMLSFGALLGSVSGAIAGDLIAVSSVHMALLTMGAFFSAVFGTPIAATALVFSLAGGTSSENFIFLVSVVGANFFSHWFTGVFQKDRLATQGLYRHEIRFRNGMCFNTLSAITVKDAMLSWVQPIAKGASISAAYNTLMESRFLKLPVIDAEKRLVGMLSLADFYSLMAWKNLEKDSQVHELLGIEDIMKPSGAVADSSMSLEEALFVMGDEEIVPVVEPSSTTFAGILLKSDVMNTYNKEVVKKASGRGRLYR